MNLQQYKQEAEQELFSILDYWMNYSADHSNGGFYGKINNDNIVDVTAPKGAVLNARILWTFSAAFNHYQNKKYLDIASRTFDYIEKYFFDKEFGGVFWTVDAKGKMLNSKKQIYATAFTIYGLSEFFAASKNAKALNTALQLVDSIEEFSRDTLMGGYLEAFTREWGEPEDVRLSDKDANEKKTMNTHLHIVEAYANLYKVHPTSELKDHIIHLLHLFDAYFIDSKTSHLKLFFDETWKDKTDIISFGHDVEAAWLLMQCAEIINEDNWINKFKQHAVTIAGAAFEAIDNDGGLWHEYDLKNKNLIREKHWWVQAEAMIGFFNAWQLSGDEKFLQQSINVWQFIKQYIIDKKNGEWFWGVKEDHSIMQNEDKVGLWKCPYHNSRACLEIIKRINNINSN